MHRLIPALCVALLAGCGAAPPPIDDPSHVEKLRIRITKARNAIEETRHTIGRARGATHLPELYVRLAELLSEEARYHYQVAFEREQQTKELHVPQVRFLKERSIEIYKIVLERYPETPLAARVLFNLGQEYRELGDYEKMREFLAQLVERHARSPLVNDALLVLGDDRFDRSDLPGAASDYRKIIKRKPSRVLGLAHYKLAWVYVNQGNCKGALREFERAILAAQAWVEAADARVGQDEAGTQSDLDVRREALVNLTYCQSRERPPKEAVPYLRKMAYDRGAYVAALSRLADRFSTMDQADGAADVARELLRLAPDDADRLDDARMLHAALRRTNDFTFVGEDVHLIGRALLRHVRKPHVPAPARERFIAEFEKYARDLGTRAQERWRSEKKADGKAALAEQVALSYAAYLQAFPDSEFSREVLENLADVLAESGREFAAGRRYLAAAQRRSAADPGRVDVLYDAVAHLQSSLEQATGRRLMERVVARAGLRKAAAELLQTQLPPERSRKVKFAMAQTDYDEGRAREAIHGLTAVALEYPNTPEGDASVLLVIEAFQTNNDNLGLITAGHAFLAATSPVSPEVKAKIRPAVTAAEQNQLDELSLVAAGVDGGDVTGELQRFAERYAGSALGERALLNAFVAARSAGDSAALGKLADEIQSKYPESEQLPGVLSTLARTSAARFEFDKAVQYFARAADADPNQRVPLRVAEGRLREQLGDYGGARAAYEVAVSAGATPAERAQGGARLADLLELLGDDGALINRLEGIKGDGDPGALSVLGAAYARKGRYDDAEMVLQQVVEVDTAASPAARARAYYAQAEALNSALSGYQPEGDVEALYELITLIEVTEQSYLKAAREAHPVYTPAALGRLAFMTQKSAGRLRALQAPASMSGAEAKALQDAMNSRAASLEKTATDALVGCAEQAWSQAVFTPPARVCLMGTAPATDPVAFDKLKPRGAVNVDVEALRQRLSKNPEDLEALRQLGEALLDGGDPHGARLAFARATQTGGGPVEMNLLGVASQRAGDVSGALEAFARAATGGSEAGRQNLATALRQAGLATAAEQATQRFSAGRPGGRMLGGK